MAHWWGVQILAFTEGERNFLMLLHERLRDKDPICEYEVGKVTLTAGWEDQDDKDYNPHVGKKMAKDALCTLTFYR